MSELAKGLYAYKPRQTAPDFIIVDLSIKKAAFIEWLQNEAPDEEFIKVQIKSGLKDPNKWYGELNDYKPKGNTQPPHPQQQQPQGYQPQGYQPQGYQPQQQQQSEQPSFDGMDYGTEGPAPWEQDY